MIAVIDDSSSSVLLLGKLLAKHGLHVAMFTNPSLALKFIPDNHRVYDAVFLDIVMPKVGGLQIANKLREVGFKKPIICVTAYNKNEFMVDLNVMDYWLHKPIVKADLVTILKECKLIEYTD